MLFTILRPILTLWLLVCYPTKIYGKENYASLLSKIQNHANERGIKLKMLKSNHEGVIVDEIQAAYKKFDGIVINPAAYTHTSIALLDALKAVDLPTVEVHISDVSKREAYRQISYVREACIATISGHGTDGYLEAIDLLIDHIKSMKNETL